MGKKKNNHNNNNNNSVAATPSPPPPSSSPAAMGGKEEELRNSTNQEKEQQQQKQQQQQNNDNTNAAILLSPSPQKPSFSSPPPSSASQSQPPPPATIAANPFTSPVALFPENGVNLQQQQQHYYPSPATSIFSTPPLPPPSASSTAPGTTTTTTTIPAAAPAPSPMGGMLAATPPPASAQVGMFPDDPRVLEMAASGEASPFVSGYLAGLAHAHRQALRHVSDQGAIAEGLRRCDASVTTLTGRMREVELAFAAGRASLMVTMRTLASRVRTAENSAHELSKVLHVAVGRLESCESQLAKFTAGGASSAVALALNWSQAILTPILYRLHLSWLVPFVFGAANVEDVSRTALTRWMATNIIVEVLLRRIPFLPAPLRGALALLRLLLWIALGSLLARTADRAAARVNAVSALLMAWAKANRDRWRKKRNAAVVEEEHQQGEEEEERNRENSSAAAAPAAESHAE